MSEPYPDPPKAEEDVVEENELRHRNVNTSDDTTKEEDTDEDIEEGDDDDLPEIQNISRYVIFALGAAIGAGFGVVASAISMKC